MIGEGLVGDKDPEEVQERPFYRLMFFVLDKAYRGQSLGSKVLEAAISRAYEDFGVRPIVLEVQKDNENAARFYERNGFTRTSYRVGDDYYFVRGL
jgi:ribosomal protein S18 acetylase RimI-like enzyme